MGCSSTKIVVVDPQQEVQIGFLDKYELAEVLGEGAYGTVRLAHSVEDNEELAVKILDLESGKKHPSQWRKSARAEHKVWARTGEHPDVVGLRECVIEDRFAYFVMELCVGSLFQAWNAEPDLNEYTYAPYFKEMAQALAHIHSVGVVHRDVKQDNFVVGAPDGRTVKLCDFGLSAVMVGQGDLSHKVGTPSYMAPEMLSEMGTYGASVDVWSFGVIVYTAFFGCWPYRPTTQTTKGVAKAIREGTVPPSFAPTTMGLRNVVSRAATLFVKRLLDRDPLTRPSAASCLEMSYLSEGHCNQLQANGKNEGRISLVPHFWAGVRCGALKTRTSKADVRQQRHLTQLHSTAQSRRESCLPNRVETRRSQPAPSDVVGVDPMPSQPWFDDTQGHEQPLSTKAMSIVIDKTSASDVEADSTGEQCERKQLV